MKIQDILFRNGIIINLRVMEKKKVLTKLGQFLASINSIAPQEGNVLVQKILDREADISTGIGYGIAIPHARTDLVDRIYMVAARCKKGIEFDALDELPVHLIFMLVSPVGNSDDLRSILSALSKIMSFEDMRDKLISTSDPEKFLSYIIEGENKYVTE